MSRGDSCKALERAPKGTFLVRNSSNAGSLCISLSQPSKVLHLLILRRNNGWGVDPVAWAKHEISEQTFDTVQQLVLKLQEYGLVGNGLVNQIRVPEMKRVVSQDTVERLNIESEYKGMLSALIMDKSTSGLSESSVRALKEWRSKHGLADEQHAKVLRSLGLSPSEFDSLCNASCAVVSSRPILARSPSEDESGCVVCMASSRVAAFVPCGHMATCMDCANMLSDCPLCREPILRVIKVLPQSRSRGTPRSDDHSF